MSFRRRPRWLALLALIALLFQQVALASHFCAPDDVPPPASLAEAHCHAAEPAAAALTCAQHCSQLVPAPEQPTTPTVPLMLPVTTWLLPLALDGALATAAPAADIHARATAPPLNIRDCSWQI